MLSLTMTAWVAGATADTRDSVAERVTKLTRASKWTRVESVRVAFTTHHPQGLVKVGDALLVSSVEIKRPTRRLPHPVDGFDRDAGEGLGHVFKMTMSGRLVADLTVGEGSVYHPGGIDYDGKHVWVAVAEYRPDSRSIVYRIDPGTMQATEILRVADHLGAIVHNTDDNTLHGVSWGSRRFYRWTLDARGKVTNAGASPESLRTLNPSHYVDYQDCKYVGRGRMLCSGIAGIGPTATGGSFELGGLDLVSLVDGRPLHQVPVALWTATGTSLTRNPVFIEPTALGLRGYFMPEDDVSTLYIYEVEVS
jgi:Family of unknown function (DUF6454)